MILGEKYVAKYLITICHGKGWESWWSDQMIRVIGLMDVQKPHNCNDISDFLDKMSLADHRLCYSDYL